MGTPNLGGGNRNRGSFGTGFGMGTLMGMGMSGGRRRHSRRGFGGGMHGGTGTGCLVAILVIIAIVVLIGIVNSIGDISGNTFSATPSTRVREALPLNAADSSAPLFSDSLGWIENRAVLERGLNDFHTKTGVRPLLYITDNLSGNTRPSNEDMRIYAKERYQELIGSNQAHLLLLFFEYDLRNYKMQIEAGSQALTVMDEAEAQEILLDYVQRYYYSDYENSQMFSIAFSQAADRIMHVTKSPWIPVFIVFGIVLIIFIAYTWWNKQAEIKRRKAAETERILNQPLEAFGSDDAASQLAKQYEDK
jgi:hypothetical protein